MINNSLQGDLQEAIRNALGCANSYEGDLYALCDLYGVADGAVSGRLIPVAQKHSPTIGTASGALNYLLQNPTVLPSLGLNFVDGTDRLDSRVTFTRASNAWRFNSAGVLTQATTNTPRFDYDPATLAPRGLLIEEQRTNSIRNNTMVGAVAGTPGTLPTNWFVVNLGLTQQIVGAGTENGINYIDIRFSGTTTSKFGSINFDPTTATAASASQTWTEAVFIKLVAGSTTGLSSIGLGMYFNDSVPALISASTLAVTPTASLTRYQNTATAPTNTAYVRPAIYFNSLNASGDAVDFTIRIGLPQLEQGAFATSPIPTSGAAATRAADVAVMTGTNFSSWYNQTEGTLFADINLPANYTTGFPTIYSANDGTANNNIVPAINASADVINVEMKVGGSVVAGFYPAYTSGTTKLAFAYKLNDVNYGKDGAVGVTDTSAAIPVVSQLNLGSNQSPTNFLNGYLRRIAYYPRRLSNTELQAITS